MRSMCSSARALIEQRLDGQQLREQDEHDLDTHLQQCALCRAFASDLTLILGIAERLPREAAPQSLLARVMVDIPASAPAQPAGWLQRLRWAWAPLAGLAGVLLLVYHTMSGRGVSLANLPRALSEWAAMINLADLGTVMNATSLFSWSVGAEMFLALALLLVGVFGIMAHVMSRQPATRLAARH